MAEAQNTPANTGNGDAAAKQQTPADSNQNKGQGAKKPAAQNTPANTGNGDAAPAKSSEESVHWVEGFGNVTAKSQAEAEKKAKQIIEDRRK